MGEQAAGASRREKVIRGCFAIVGALGAAVLALTVNVATPFVIDFVDGETATADAACIEEWRDPAVGTELIDVLVSPAGDGQCWTRSIDLDAAKFDVLMKYQNFRDEAVKDVSIEALLPDGVKLIAGTTRVANATNPDGLTLDTHSDHIVDTGINIGNYAPGANAWITFSVQVTDEFEAACGVGMLGVSGRIWHPFVSTWASAAAITDRSC